MSASIFYSFPYSVYYKFLCTCVSEIGCLDAYLILILYIVMCLSMKITYLFWVSMLYTVHYFMIPNDAAVASHYIIMVGIYGFSRESVIFQYELVEHYCFYDAHVFTSSCLILSELVFFSLVCIPLCS